jgi:hypothetical protein
MAAGADPLRSTLDTLELDPRSEADRPYLVAMLRRLGYTERDIEETLRTGKMPTAQPTATDLAPARDYTLVVPARDTRFALEESAGAGTDAPFEDLERVEFEDPSEDVTFEEVTEATPAVEPTWEMAPDGPDEEDMLKADEAGAEGAEGAQGESTEGAEGEGMTAADEDARLDATPIDTFGDAEITRGKTRVRVRRVRAGSKEEAERKVAGGGRTVIKSVPVDIVERWGSSGKGAAVPRSPPAATPEAAGEGEADEGKGKGKGRKGAKGG